MQHFNTAVKGCQLFSFLNCCCWCRFRLKIFWHTTRHAHAHTHTHKHFQKYNFVFLKGFILFFVIVTILIKISIKSFTFFSSSTNCDSIWFNFSCDQSWPIRIQYYWFRKCYYTKSDFYIFLSVLYRCQQSIQYITMCENHGKNTMTVTSRSNIFTGIQVRICPCYSLDVDNWHCYSTVQYSTI